LPIAFPKSFVSRRSSFKTNRESDAARIETLGAAAAALVPEGFAAYLENIGALWLLVVSRSRSQ
jgi:hypothetical protein